MPFVTLNLSNDQNEGQWTAFNKVFVGMDVWFGTRKMKIGQNSTGQRQPKSTFARR